jgi:signal transduction histidine kinase
MYLQYNRVLRIASFGIWVAVMLPTLILAAGWHLRWPHSEPRLLAWGLFGVALWINLGFERLSLAVRIGLLALQTVSALWICTLIPNYYVGFLLVVPAWQLAMTVPHMITALWVALQSVVLLVILVPICSVGMGWADAGICICVQALACVTVLLAQREAELSAEQKRVNRELMATRELLVESSRSNERLRISQELHDVLGHRLAALSIRLEVAHMSTGMESKDVHVVKAQELAQSLLTDVREVVGALRNWENIDVGRALETVSTEVPGLQVHLQKPAKLQVESASSANALVRCVQEVITNTLKHARAKNLWIDIEVSAGVLRVEAHDDGCGASEMGLGGLGLSGMKSRFETLGGGVAVQSPTSAGFALSAWLPITTQVTQP